VVAGAPFARGRNALFCDRNDSCGESSTRESASARAAIAIESRRAIYVGPDNGLFELALERDPMVRAVTLTNTANHLPEVSATFHGRDIFAPVAATPCAGYTFATVGPAD